MIDAQDPNFYLKPKRSSPTPSDVWRSTKDSLKKAKRNAQQTFRQLAQRWPLRRNHRGSKASASSGPPEWQQPSGTSVHQNQAEYHPHPITIHNPVAAPLATPEPLDHIEKPSITVYKETPSPIIGAVRGYQPNRVNQRLRFVEDEDPGIMSEVETSATVGAHSRRNMRSRQYPNDVPMSTAMNNNFIHTSTSSVSNLPYGPEKSVGLLYLNYQGETKRSLLPDDIRSLDDIRNMFLKSFPTSFNMDYLHAPHVKIYVQDPARQDVFYELEDLRDVKDRTVLKLHEQLRPISPIPVNIQSTVTATSGAGTVYDIPAAQRSAQSATPTPTPTGQYQASRDHPDEMNYFSEPELDGPYRGQKPLGYSSIPPGGASPFNRRYGTLDAYYRSSDRVKYNGNGPPAKPQRFAGTVTPTRGLMLQSGRPASSTIRSNYGSSGESEVEAYTSRGYGMDQNQTYNPNDRLMNVSRSGSVTPVIDEEARARMLNMEKQLDNLSSLVHSALMAKGVSETVYKDIAMLRREILGPPSSTSRDDTSDSGSVSRFSDISSDKGSFTLNDRDCQIINKGSQQHSPPQRDIYSTGFVNQDYNRSGLSPETKQLLKNVKKRTSEIQIEIKYLRRMAQVNAQSARDVLKDAFDRIRVILNTNKQLHMFAAQAQQQNLVENNPLLSDRSWVNQEQERYRNLIRNVEQDLNTFEKQTEELRQKVISGDRKLRISEVEGFTELLTNISKTAANLKTQFPNLQERLKFVMSAEMEKVVREEKFLKDEPSRLDSALKKCKKLTNTMVTMKKLALVQDPNAYQNADKERSHSTIPEPSSESKLPNFTSSSRLSNPLYPNSTLPRPPPSSPAIASDNYRKPMLLDQNRNPPLLDQNRNPALVDSPPRKPSLTSTLPLASEMTNGKHQNDSTKVLDNLLEELQNVAKNGPTPEKQHNGEKRVGFNDQVKHIVISDKEPGDSDTIKRSPKTFAVAPMGVTNIAYEKNNMNGGLTNGNGTYDENMNFAPPVKQHAELPVYAKTYINRNVVPPYIDNLSNRMHTHSPQLNMSSNHNRDRSDRSHSGTPLSVASEPASFSRYEPAPAPPPRSSSRTMVNAPTYSINSSRNNFKTSDIAELKHQLTHVNGSMSMHSPMRSTLAPPAVVTNAVDEETRGIKSASSSESVNSQEALSLTKPPPPPPPPRNKQEMLEQRQHELMSKQRRFQTTYTKLQDTKRQPNGTLPTASSQYI